MIYWARVFGCSADGRSYKCNAFCVYFVITRFCYSCNLSVDYIFLLKMAVQSPFGTNLLCCYRLVSRRRVVLWVIHSVSEDHISCRPRNTTFGTVFRVCERATYLVRSVLTYISPGKFSACNPKCSFVI